MVPDNTLRSLSSWVAFLFLVFLPLARLPNHMHSAISYVNPTLPYPDHCQSQAFRSVRPHLCRGRCRP